MRNENQGHAAARIVGVPSAITAGDPGGGGGGDDVVWVDTKSLTQTHNSRSSSSSSSFSYSYSFSRRKRTIRSSITTRQRWRTHSKNIHVLVLLFWLIWIVALCSSSYKNNSPSWNSWWLVQGFGVDSCRRLPSQHHNQRTPHSGTTKVVSFECLGPTNGLGRRKTKLPALSNAAAKLVAAGDESNQNNGDDKKNKNNNKNNKKEVNAFSSQQLVSNQRPSSSSLLSSQLTTTAAATLGLSRFHQSILSRTSSIRQQQSFVTGRYPLTVSFRSCPTRQWLLQQRRDSSSQELLVNQTTLSKSLASPFGRWQWLEDNASERHELVQACHMMRMEFVAEIHWERPGYVQLLPSQTAGSSAAQWRQRRSSSTNHNKKTTNGGRTPFVLPQPNQPTSQSPPLPSWGSINPKAPPVLQPSSSSSSSLSSLLLLSSSNQPLFDVADCPMLDNDRLWVTGFSLAARSGRVYSMDADSGEIVESVNARTKSLLLWPNEVALVPQILWRTRTRTRRTRNRRTMDNNNNNNNNNNPHQDTNQKSNHPTCSSSSSSSIDEIISSPTNTTTSMTTGKNNPTTTTQASPPENSQEEEEGVNNHINGNAKVNGDSFPSPTTQQENHCDDDDDDDDDKCLQYQDALLVADGFLVPGKDRGGLYLVRHPGNPETEWTVRLTSADDRWFYHRATWMDLTGDGRLSILTARCQVSTRFPPSSGHAKRRSNPKKGQSQSQQQQQQQQRKAGLTDMIASGICKQGQLVWLECPQPHSIDAATGTPLEADGTIFDPLAFQHLPWKTRVLATGPDVMFSVADLDPTDDTVEVLCSEFFNQRVTLKSIRLGRPRRRENGNDSSDQESLAARLPSVVFERIIDDRCGAAFGCILADLDGPDKDEDSRSSSNKSNSWNSATPTKCPTVLDSGSTVPCLTQGDLCSHLLVTSHECTYAEETDATSLRKGIPFIVDGEGEAGDSSDRAAGEGVAMVRGTSFISSSSPSTSAEKQEGGSLFAYRIPQNKNNWKTDPWIRSTVATGFKVKGQLGNMINPGAPGFVYTFHAKEEVDDNFRNKSNKRRRRRRKRRPLIAVAGDCAESAYLFRPETTSLDVYDQQQKPYPSQFQQPQPQDPSTCYQLMVEIQCQATVGSIGIGYNDFLSLPTQESGYAKLYIPCFEKDKILVFALGSGEGVLLDEEDGDDW